ncbi:MAG TPA: hypothetical protein VIM70_09415 [Clostridium sp.]|uniref:hypothetical protein n=1 Tax=Clostridium sp. TaxID=1506 RepID=UPI002F9545D4
MKRRKIFYVTLFIAAFSTISGVITYAAGVAMPGGTVVIGTKAYDITYANDSKNESEITAALLAGGEIYVKDFGSSWVDNSTSAIINANILPSVTYKSATGIISTYSAGDAGNSTPVTDEFKILSIE